MADRPIIFSAPMVRALLAGRKTQTRRLLTPQPETFMVDGGECDVQAVHVHGEAAPRVATGRVLTAQKLRFAIGDRLYVRESWSHSGNHVFEISQARLMGRSGVIYKADESPRYPDAKFWPSIHMPREFSRLTLTVEDVGVERLQKISEADACAEGAPRLVHDGEGTFYEHPEGTHRCGFAGIWSHLHGPEAWDANPFVVALTFSVSRGNIDGFPA
jgi:hypothetical protein